ncbi:MAG TPA: GlxA family transcriptional regulator [Myxococcota bacterium]|nr:GlxA family transcriptional regulator [Myxococcota bacterium]
MLAFPRAQVLDVTGPLEVFAMATQAVSRPEQGYRIELVAARRGPLEMSSGLRLVADAGIADVRGPVDTLLVAGGEGVRDAIRDRRLLSFLARTAARARRVASVCTGSFLLAEAGLLAGRRATTHWGSGDRMARRYPDVTVEPDRIYVRDGPIYTSAGVTAGIDLALALVEEDFGRDLALTVARRLVVFLKRPGGQSQFSAQLSAQIAERPALRDLQLYIEEHPGDGHTVESLARRVGMSPRHFARVFTRELGVTPARYVERVRVEAARRRLEEGEGGVEQVAAGCGFGSSETMRRAFLRSLRVSPSEYRQRFRLPVGARPEEEIA